MRIGVPQYKYDEYGNEGYMVVNYTDSYKKISNEITMNIVGKNKAVVLINGKKKIVDIKKNVLKFTLHAGEGAFVLPY